MTMFDLNALIQKHTEGVKADLGYWNRVEAAKRIVADIPADQLRFVLTLALPVYLAAHEERIAQRALVASQLATSSTAGSGGTCPQVKEFDPELRAKQIAQSRRMASIPAYKRMLQKKVSPWASTGAPRQDELGDCGAVECRLLSTYHGKLEGTHGRLKRGYTELGDRIEKEGVAKVRDLPVDVLEEFASILLDGEDVNP